MTWQYSKEGWVKPGGKFFPSLWPISVWAHILTGSGDAREFVARRVSGVGWFLCPASYTRCSVAVLVRLLFTSPYWEWLRCCPSANLDSVSHMMLSRALPLAMCLALVVITQAAPNIPRSYLPPAADPPAPECRVITEEQEQEVKEEECTVTEVETCDTGIDLFSPKYQSIWHFDQRKNFNVRRWWHVFKNISL